MAKLSVNKTVWAQILRKVSQKTNNHYDAEDYLHSAFLKLNRYQAGNEVRSHTAFLVSAARNIGIDAYRHQRHSADRAERLEILDNSPLQDEVIAARVRLERVKAGLAQLPLRSRQVLLMRRLEGKSYDEIARCLGISRSTVERTIASATSFLIEWSKGW